MRTLYHTWYHTLYHTLYQTLLTVSHTHTFMHIICSSDQPHALTLMLIQQLIGLLHSDSYHMTHINAACRPVISCVLFLQQTHVRYVKNLQ